MSEIQKVIDVLHENTKPIFYVNRPSTHFLGVEKYVANFYSIRLSPLWEETTGRAANTFIPSNTPQEALSHSAAVHWLLENKEVQSFIADKTPAGETPTIIVSVQDAESEKICARLGYDFAWIPNSEYKRFDGKLFGTQLSENVGIKNVPNIITRANSWESLREKTIAAGIGDDLVVQTDYGEGGAGTYLISSPEGFEEARPLIIGKKLKVMKRIKHRSLAMEAVVLPSGIILGPLLQEIVGHKEVAVHPGSSSGLEFYHDVLDDSGRKKSQEMVLKYGQELIKEGYTGIYEVDILEDLETGELFFGESNPRVTGCAMVTNALTAQIWGVPLYALSLYSFLGMGKNLDVSQFNKTWDEVAGGIEWANLILRHTSKQAVVTKKTPLSGVYSFDESLNLKFVRKATDWFDLQDSNEFFLLSYRNDGDVQVYGDEIATVYMRATFQTRDGALTSDSKKLVNKILGLYEVKNLGFFKRAKNSLLRRLRSFRG